MNRHTIAMRLRFPELLEERGLTRYRLAQLCLGRISQRQVYRYVDSGGHVRSIITAHLEVLREVLNAKPDELIEWKKAPKPKRQRKVGSS
jgi:hypothetical protein